MTNLEKLAILATLACVVKFLAEGVSLVVFGQSINLGHADSMAYAALLAPLWGSHSYITGKKGEQDVKQG